ncbi:MAG: hypothetical protein DRQ51_01020 [Gammaproteobacteria bacterium]|nr:MAG: hypothetical protein DRQ51_01020 [Gammaproteobacteria bacterium]
MQTLKLQVKDNFMQDFLTIVAKYGDYIKIERDDNLKADPYFYARQKQLHQDLKDIDSGKVVMHSKAQYDKNMKDFLHKLNAKYENQTVS